MLFLINFNIFPFYLQKYISIDMFIKIILLCQERKVA